VESGGAVVDMGRACAFVLPDGTPLPWLHSIDSIAVNGRHAIFIAESLVRVEMSRIARTCELAITLHTLSTARAGRRPAILSKMLFQGRDGVLPLDLWKRENAPHLGQVTPMFYSRSGEVMYPPQQFEGAVRKITAAVCCIGCQHSHLAAAATETDPALRFPQASIEVGEPNWAPLERIFPARECANFMYMGAAGEIELYKHRHSRRYVNIGRDSNRFYRYSDGSYIEITQAEALEQLRG
jgi:hypothetical protein